MDGGEGHRLKDTREAFFQTVHVRDMTAFLKLAVDPTDFDSFAQIYNKTCAYFNRSVPSTVF